ncbi:hypothetical protein B0H16DRAFT_1457312 [Mycena metata]|uniref:Uncharacterized protein n=1 Tax=Mycena metata TaxID=1033252 RepID=A0AAD7NFY8_9AGAR|nr:hypothetical protein B0H16DRAFT_1457312 [Mycena metata]
MSSAQITARNIIPGRVRIFISGGFRGLRCSGSVVRFINPNMVKRTAAAGSILPSRPEIKVSEGVYHPTGFTSESPDRRPQTVYGRMRPPVPVPFMSFTTGSTGRDVKTVTVFIPKGPAARGERHEFPGALVSEKFWAEQGSRLRIRIGTDGRTAKYIDTTALRLSRSNFRFFPVQKSWGVVEARVQRDVKARRRVVWSEQGGKHQGLHSRLHVVSTTITAPRTGLESEECGRATNSTLIHTNCTPQLPPEAPAASRKAQRGEQTVAHPASSRTAVHLRPSVPCREALLPAVYLALEGSAAFPSVAPPMMELERLVMEIILV